MGLGSLRTTLEGGRLIVAASGAWTIEGAAALDSALRPLPSAGAKGIAFDLGAVTALDTAGAWLVERTRLLCQARGLSFSVSGAAPAFAPLIERVAALGLAPVPPVQAGRGLTDFIAQVGQAMVAVLLQARDMVAFFGAVVVALLRSIRQPGRIRLVSFISHLEQVGLNALPIVGLMAFLIGIVLAYQGVDQLRRFGAEVFMVNLVGVSVLREMGIVLTAVVIAGRSGSAFTAQIGTMQVNEEVDAMRTLGLDPLDVLVLPRILALMVALPLLTFFADVAAILGGALMASVLIDMSLPSFLNQLRQAVTLTTFWIGIGKAPVFAFLIAMVGCFEGLRVQGSAESVGRLTTQSVVEAIFLVVVFDALFSVMFSYLGI